MIITPTSVKEQVDLNLERLLAPWMVGRPDGYSMSSDARYAVAVGRWLDEQLRTLCNDEDRKTQGWKFSRLSRSYDIFAAAAECLNEALQGTVEQGRRPHRRWG